MACIDKEFFENIAPSLPIKSAEEIVAKNRHLSLDELAGLLIEKNEEFEQRKNLPSKRFDNRRDDPQSKQAFFTKLCNRKPCNSRACTYAHNEYEIRRPQFIFKYNDTPCRFVFSNNAWDNPKMCKAGNMCRFAHTQNEIDYYIHGPRENPKSNSFPHENPNRPQENPNLNEVPQQAGPSEIIDPVEFVKFSEPPSNDVAHAFKACKDLSSDIEDRKSQLIGKQKELERINQHLCDLNNKSLCVRCKYYNFDYIAIPCGHPICKFCCSSSNCPYCGLLIKEALALA